LVLVPYINGIGNLVPDPVLKKLKISGSSSATSSQKSDPILIWFLPTETRTNGANPPNQVNARHYNKPEITIKQIEDPSIFLTTYWNILKKSADFRNFFFKC
jgi:hypothetical protein